MKPYLTELRKRAIALYKPPFTFYHGYIYDADGHMVSDDHIEDTTAMHEIRGWGRIQKFENPEALQDEVGHMIADAINQYYEKLAEAPTVDCKQCANRGQINGTSQELVCDSCIHYGSNWRKDMFVPTGED